MTEIEVKIRVDDFKKIEESLNEFTDARIIEWEFEDNIVFDFPDLRLKREGRLFRLRKEGGKTIITFKTPSEDKDEKFKIREEFETIVSDYDKMMKIIGLLGLKVFFRYQKYRKTYIIDGNHISLDKTPIGNFIEIEGDKEYIMKLAKLLGKSEADFITSSYYTLFREKYDKGDMVFDG
jgi:adenylate cyclase class 2